MAHWQQNTLLPGRTHGGPTHTAVQLGTAVKCAIAVQRQFLIATSVAHQPVWPVHIWWLLAWATGNHQCRGGGGVTRCGHNRAACNCVHPVAA